MTAQPSSPAWGRKSLPSCATRNIAVHRRWDRSPYDQQPFGPRPPDLAGRNHDVKPACRTRRRRGGVPARDGARRRTPDADPRSEPASFGDERLGADEPRRHPHQIKKPTVQHASTRNHPAQTEIRSDAAALGAPGRSRPPVKPRRPSSPLEGLHRWNRPQTEPALRGLPGRVRQHRPPTCVHAAVTRQRVQPVPHEPHDDRIRTPHGNGVLHRLRFEVKPGCQRLLAHPEHLDVTTQLLTGDFTFTTVQRHAPTPTLANADGRLSQSEEAPVGEHTAGQPLRDIASVPGTYDVPSSFDSAILMLTKLRPSTMPQCRCGPVELPVLPERAIC